MGIKGGYNVAEYVYDFSVDGGAAGEIALHSKDGKVVLPIGAVIMNVVANVVTQCTSDGSATIAWGDGVDKDGYSGPTPAVAGFTANSTHNGYDNAADLIWDDTDDHAIYPYLTSASTGEFNLTIATADLTAGKIVFSVVYLEPGIAG